MLKAAAKVPDIDVRKNLKEEISLEFHTCKNLVDNNAIKTAIANGQRSLSRLDDLSGTKSVYSKRNGGSWIDTQDEDDVRGRVGTGWPWS
jgi:hypothetical protein